MSYAVGFMFVATLFFHRSNTSWVAATGCEVLPPDDAGTLVRIQAFLEQLGSPEGGFPRVAIGKRREEGQVPTAGRLATRDASRDQGKPDRAWSRRGRRE